MPETVEAPSAPGELAARVEIEDLDHYLEVFYDDSISYGDSIQETITSTEYWIKEVIVGTDTRARGYVTLDDHGDPAYFIDVDRDHYIMTTVDLVSEVSDTFEDIDQDSFYSVNDYDFLDIIDEINHEGEDAYSGALSGRITIPIPPIWGPGMEDCGAPYYDSNLICVRNCIKYKVRFFIHFFHQEVTIGATGC